MRNLLMALAFLGLAASPALAYDEHRPVPPAYGHGDDYYWHHHYRHGHWQPCHGEPWHRCWVWGGDR